MKRANPFFVTLCIMMLFAAAGCNIFHEQNDSGIADSVSLKATDSDAAVSNAENMPDVSGAVHQNTVDGWVKKAPMLTPRGAFGCEVINGEIYAIGGRNQSGNLSSAERYSIKTDKWTELKPMSAPRSEMQTAILDGKIYAVGGDATKDNGMGMSVNTVERFDPEANTWLTLKPMNMARMYHRLAVIGETIYAIGGSADSTVLSTVEAYDPASNTWKKKAPMSVPRMHFGMEIIGGKIYVIGGCNSSDPVDAFDVLATVEMYDPETDKWIKKASMPTPRLQFETKVIDGKIYAIGGYNESGDLSAVEEYDPVSDTWTTKKSMPTPRAWFQTEVLKGKIYAIGGWKKVGDYSSESYLSSVEEYDPKSDIWMGNIPALPAKDGFQTEIIDGKLYAIGAAGGAYVFGPEPFAEIAMATADSGYAIDRNFHVLKTLDGGANWLDLLTVNSALDYSDHPALFVLDDKTVFAAFYTADGIEVGKSSDSGASWSRSAIKKQGDDLHSGYGGSLVLSFINPSDGFLLASSPPALGQMGKAFYKTTDGGSEWSLVANLDHGNIMEMNGYTTGMAFFNTEVGYITCTYHGQKEISVYKTVDGGKSWSVAPLPLPAKYTSLNDANQYYVDAYSPAFFGEGNEHAKMELYFCHDDERCAYIYSSDNGGNTWRVDGVSSTLMTKYCFADAENGFGLDENGVLYATKDGGATWRVVS